MGHTGVPTQTASIPDALDMTDAAEIVATVSKGKKCFIVQSPDFLLKQKTTKSLVVRRLETILRIVPRIGYFATLLTRKSGDLFFVVILQNVRTFWRIAFLYSDA